MRRNAILKKLQKELVSCDKIKGKKRVEMYLHTYKLKKKNYLLRQFDGKAYITH